MAAAKVIKGKVIARKASGAVDKELGEVVVYTTQDAIKYAKELISGTNYLVLRDVTLTIGA